MWLSVKIYTKTQMKKIAKLSRIGKELKGESALPIILPSHM